MCVCVCVYVSKRQRPLRTTKCQYHNCKFLNIIKDQAGVQLSQLPHIDLSLMYINSNQL